MIQIAQLENIEELKKSFDPKLVEKALYFANLKTTQKTRTLISKLVRQEWAVKAGDISRHVKIKKNYNGNSDVLLLYAGKRLALQYFGAKEVKNIGGRAVTTYRAKDGLASTRAKRATKRSGVTIRLKKGKARELVKGYSRFGGKNSKNLGFFINGRVFARIGKERNKLSKLTGPAIPQMVTPKIFDKAFEFIKQEHPDQFVQHLQKLMDGIIK